MVMEMLSNVYMSHPMSFCILLKIVFQYQVDKLGEAICEGLNAFLERFEKHIWQLHWNQNTTDQYYMLSKAYNWMGEKNDGSRMMKKLLLKILYPIQLVLIVKKTEL
ncbi:hypothetical protein CHUAL_010752 [Chamberlinius hualienensis]